MGLEPTAPCLQSRCSSQLSYTPADGCPASYRPDEAALEQVAAVARRGYATGGATVVSAVSAGAVGGATVVLGTTRFFTVVGGTVVGGSVVGGSVVVVVLVVVDVVLVVVDRSTLVP